MAEGRMKGLSLRRHGADASWPRHARIPWMKGTAPTDEKARRRRVVAASWAAGWHSKCAARSSGDTRDAASQFGPHSRSRHERRRRDSARPDAVVGRADAVVGGAGLELLRKGREPRDESRGRATGPLKTKASKTG